MIALPPGCTVTYAVWIDVDKLLDEMVEWYSLIGGKVYQDRWYNHHGKEQSVYYEVMARASGAIIIKTAQAVLDYISMVMMHQLPACLS